jgi:diguanylate cyclase (GGDEF)-like protein
MVMSQCDCNKESLEIQIKALKDLIEVAKAVVSTLDLDTVLQAILSSAMVFSETPAGSVALYDDKNGELTLHVHSGLSAAFIKKERWTANPGGLTEQVLSAREIFFIEDTGKTSFFNNPIAVKEGIRSMICVPLILHDRTMGILYLDDFVPRQFDREKMNLLAVLASFASMSIYNATLHKKTKLMAITDALTGLHNHRFFKQHFTQEIDRAKRYKKPLSIIMLDVDDFKKFNDRFGHSTGDLILMTIGRIIGKTVRGVDFAFRYGGEEFIVLLPETELQAAIHVAERLRIGIQEETVMQLGGVASQGVTVSIGVASFPDSANKQDDLFNIVDGLLYKAKELGKNKVYSFTGEESSPQ